MVAERLTRAFWPFWTVLFVTLAPLMLGWQDVFPLEAVWGFSVLVVIGLAVTAFIGVRAFRWPHKNEALARVDATLPGRPIATLADSQAIGTGDPASEAVWRAHQSRMAERTKDARMVDPDLRVSARDPFGLRYIALLFFLVALMFGSVWRVGSVSTMTPGAGQTAAAGPVWEGWIEPPPYTGKPSLYLADIPAGPLSVPQGSTVTLRLYGDVGSLTVAETVSGRTGEVGSASEAQQSFQVTKNGTLAINGPGGAQWQITMIPDQPPTVDLTGPVEADAKGEMSQPFQAMDDHGVTSGTATIALDLAAVDRRYGLTIDPDPRDPLVLDLPMPFNGDRSDFEEKLIEDLSEHPFANLPVTITLNVTDAAGLTGATPREQMVLPGRRFFQPLAKAVIEQRRDLLWSKSNAPEIVSVLKAISNRPDDIFTNNTTYLRLRVAIRQLEAAIPVNLSDEVQTDVAKALWDLAIQLEDGTLADARERLRRAQERLAEAMRNGASDQEIADLMQELRDAIDAYTQMLAEQSQPPENQTDQPQSSDNSMQVTRDQIQALMDRIQQLMEEGNMAEAQQLMDQLNQLMENLQVTQGQGQGDGPQTPGQQSMQDLQNTLRDQQGLSDQAFRDLQDRFNPPQSGQQPGQPGQDGQPQPGQQQPGQQGQNGQQQPGQQPGQQGQDGQQGQGLGQGDNNEGGQQGDQGTGGEGQQQSLADRQQALRQELQRQQNQLPSLDGDAGAAARRSLDRAESAMNGAEQALRDGNLADAIDKQADAMDALREGIRSMGEALAQNQTDQSGQGQQQGDANGRVEPSRRDPLGRQIGNTGQYGSDENLLQGQDVYRRAEELLNELRRRSAEQDRPQVERDYLRRLLNQF